MFIFLIAADNSGNPQIVRKHESTDLLITSEHTFDLLPDEILLSIMSYLNPRELCRAAQMCKRWNQLTMDGSLWTGVYPMNWAKGTYNLFRI